MEAPGPPPDDARTLLARDRQLSRRLVAYAYKVTHRGDTALATAQEAITRVLEGKGWCAWDPRGPKELYSHLCSVVDSLVANERARASTRREVPEDPDDEDGAPDSGPRADQRLEALETHQGRMRLAAIVMERLDEQARAMLELEQEEVHDAAKQAEKLGCSVEDIRRARERVAYHRNVVLAEHAKKRGRE